jgi:hypothetical protein
LKFEGSIKREDAMRERSNISENEKKKASGRKRRQNKLFDQTKQY